MKTGAARLLALPLILLVIGGGIYFAMRPERSPELSWEQAQTALESGEYDRVLEIANSLESISGYETKAKVLRVRGLTRMRLFTRAAGFLNELSPDGPDRQEVLIATAEFLYAQGEFARAYHFVSLLLEDDPKHVEGHRWASAILYDLGALALAEQHLFEIVRLEPGDYRPHRLLGMIHYDFEKYKEAINDYRNMLEKSPPESLRKEASLNLAKAMIKQRHPEDAIKKLQELEKAPEVLLLMAEAEFAQGHVEQAEQMLNTINEANQPRRLFLLGQIALHRKDVPGAVRLLKSAVELEPSNPELLYQLALAYRQANDLDAYEQTMAEKERVDALYQEMSDLSHEILTSPGQSKKQIRLAEICRELGKEDLATMWQQAASAIGDSPTKNKLSPNEHATGAAVDGENSLEFRK